MKRLEVYKKTRLCKFFAAGSCTSGNSCAFAHGSCQLRDKPNFSKTRLCADFLEHGWCMRGEACSFAHGQQELRLRPDLAAKPCRPAKGMAPKAPSWASASSSHVTWQDASSMDVTWQDASSMDVTWQDASSTDVQWQALPFCKCSGMRRLPCSSCSGQPARGLHTNRKQMPVLLRRFLSAARRLGKALGQNQEV